MTTLDFWKKCIFALKNISPKKTGGVSGAGWDGEGRGGAGRGGAGRGGAGRRGVKIYMRRNF